MIYNRSIFKVCAGIFVATVYLFAPVEVGADVNDFYISGFHADYFLSVDGEGMNHLLVEEEIVVIFPDFDQNHGILRAIPIEYDGHFLDPQVISVEDERGSIYPLETYKENDNLVLKIGDAYEFVHGTTTYRISYKLQDVISFFDDREELFWDVNGDQWSQEFGTVSADVHLPEDLASDLKDGHFCFAGVFGSTGKNCRVYRDGNTVAYRTEGVGPGETLTIGLNFEKGAFPVPPRKFRYDDVRWIWIILLPLVSFVYMWRKWSKLGRDPKRKDVIVRQYDIPKGMTALKASALLGDGHLRSNAITASIVEIAVLGHLHIYEKTTSYLLKEKKEYELELRESVANAPEDLRPVLQMLFGESAGEGSRFSVEENKNKLADEFVKLSDQIAEDLFREGFFVSNPLKASSKYFSMAFGVFALGMVSVFLGGLFGGIGLIVSSVVIGFFSRLMPVKTRYGVETAEHLLGLKEYMKQAEEGRINVTQGHEGAERVRVGNVEDKIHLFEKLLPYAMIFGIEKKWAKHFEEMYVVSPQWYSGDFGNMNAVMLAYSLRDLNSAGTSVFESPSSSGSGAGGGGGGGGGGGW